MIGTGRIGYDFLEKYLGRDHPDVRRSWTRPGTVPLRDCAAGSKTTYLRSISGNRDDEIPRTAPYTRLSWNQHGITDSPGLQFPHTSRTVPAFHARSGPPNAPAVAG